MKAAIEVANREEGANIKAGLALPDVKAITTIAGILDPMPYQSKMRILGFLSTTYAEARPEPPPPEEVQASLLDEPDVAEPVGKRK